MSSMVSYSVGGYASKSEVWESWNKYFIENGMQLLNDFRNDDCYKQLWELGILNNEKLKEIKSEFKKMYAEWIEENVSDKLREKIINEMNEYIIELKEKLFEDKEQIILDKFVIDVIEDKIININTNIKKSKDEEKNYLNETNFYLEKIKSFNELIYIKEETKLKELKNFSSQKAKLYLDSLKFLYLEVKKNNSKRKFYKENISRLYNHLKIKNFKNINLNNEIEYFLKTENIIEEKYFYLHLKMQEEFENLEKEIINKNIMKNIVNSLKNLNYLVIEDSEYIINNLIKGERVLLPVKSKEYGVVLKLNKDFKLLTRFIKRTEGQVDIKNITDSEKITDNENLKKWCKLQSTFNQNLQKLDININENIIENEESEVLYVVDCSILSSTQNNFKNKKDSKHG